ncbi:gluconate 2-dehydrogenase subunit 3 family protein [Rufibacter hautae]|uniref:Gluconate 2-dehydrogenase subunit 3 family protein n=1 Tax=Rufibacter hautae TaxID=2595005 RepID=A0A5B6TB80_9BACT|nr:gluconate 2-dehydrogenase subunit 3 family protein [Rufibacter hautae]KAA3436850.1 gluconate 2-dehydrogenase subunit 3 family protein [Rufibacter hautae]
MNRRTVVKGLLLFTGGLVLAPSCVMETSKASIRLKNLDISGEDEKLLGEVVETILPTTDTPGGRTLGLHRFTLKMVDDLRGEKDQKAFTDGLDAFKKLAKKELGSSFMEASPQKRQELIAAVNAGKAPQDVLAFYKLLKDHTITGYLNSELVMTKLRVYELVPGRYNPYFPVKTKQQS